MAIAAHLEGNTQGEGKRGSQRRTLRFETVGGRAAGDVQPVQVHNASATGLLLESDDALAVGDAIDIDLPHVGLTTAHVVWASGALYGCRFDTAISEAALAAAQLRSDIDLEPRPVNQPGESFGMRLQRLRKARGLTLAQLGDRLDVSKPTVWAWEKGKARPIDSRMDALAEALGVSEAELADVHDNAEARELLMRSREAIARAFGTEPGKVRIMIEL
ncbi:helix-turn-helix domain-containing protein [Pelagerythrobacter sp.]|uniref:helix-turn-helix domain-containing protein n=1 Tax=Pelagerythrobacter sp. TaxID=2800702 RepID=UPI0035B4DD10